LISRFWIDAKIWWLFVVATIHPEARVSE